MESSRKFQKKKKGTVKVKTLNDGTPKRKLKPLKKVKYKHLFEDEEE